jgi:hypothetical protein
LRVIRHCRPSDVKEIAGHLALNIVKNNVGLPIYSIFRTAFFVGAAYSPYRDEATNSEIALAHRAAKIVGDMLDDPQKSSQLSAPSRLIGARLVAHIFGPHTERGKSALTQMMGILGFDRARGDIPYPLKVEAIKFLEQQSADTGLVSSSKIEKIASGIPDHARNLAPTPKTLLSGAKIVPLRRVAAVAQPA